MRNDVLEDVAALQVAGRDAGNAPRQQAPNRHQGGGVSQRDRFAVLPALVGNLSIAQESIDLGKVVALLVVVGLARGRRGRRG